VPGPCRPPIALDPALDDPGLVRRLLEQTAPHLPVQRYFRSAAEMRAQSGPSDMIIAPNFRGDWATAQGRVPGVEPILESPRLRDAAARLFDSDRVRPWGVYSNITFQLPFHQGQGHTDVPAFLGVDRSSYPTWFLAVMGHSGLFEKERIDIATAVAWFYRGSDGGFTWWPDGPDRPPRVHEGRIDNTAFVGDNDRMYHRVRPVGSREQGLLTGMTLDTRLEHDGGDAWAIREGDRTLARMDFEALRVSVSWKAYVYRDEAQERRHREGGDALTREAVLERFYDDLHARGLRFERPADPLHDEPFVELLGETYMRTPTVFDG
jgi:hypothetical protein